MQQSENTNTIKRNTEALLEASREVGLEVNTEKTNNNVMCRHQNAGQDRNILMFKQLGTTVANQNCI
jgi:hypothetical protein